MQGRTREVRGTPNQEMAADWRVLPWRGKTAAVENAPGTTAARSPAWTRCVLAWPWAEVRERESLAAWSERRVTGVRGKNSTDDGGRRSFKVARWGGNRGGGSGDEGGTRRNSAMGPSPDRRAASRPRPWPTTARPRRARAAQLCSSSGAPGAAGAWALAGSRRGREEQGTGARGPTHRKCEVGRARMNSDDF
jgi:hypothetical protein